MGAQTFIKNVVITVGLHLCLSGDVRLHLLLHFLWFLMIHFDVDTADTVYYVKVFGFAVREVNVNSLEANLCFICQCCVFDWVDNGILSSIN